VADGWWEAALPVWNEADWDDVTAQWENRYWDLAQFLYRNQRYPLKLPRSKEDPEEPEAPLWRWVTSSQYPPQARASGEYQ
jgi:hypothetical protein